ncbi:hypothetical protein BCR44DRAFT_1226534 [Catenaria anguillulae PL171]|uniref:Nucleolar protein 9 n=1 Tax=Catenaria anguillulae PL171 TaxID=765915 RepID=A0A1Y2HE60_9FUNG|nr:hypothetical protein BCR44DRAFT_1226534 [Catenaria anguillulae PL171]
MEKRLTLRPISYVHLFKHYCASHVMQTLITLSWFAMEREAKNDASDNGPEELPSMAQLFQRLCQQLESFWADIISDRHASFVARALISVLAGTPVDAQLSTSKSSRQWAEKHNLPAPSRTIERRGTELSRNAAVPDICRRSLSTVMGELNQVLGERIRTYAFDPIVSPVAQQYLEALTDKSDVLATLLMRDDASLDISAEQRNSYIKSLMTHPWHRACLSKRSVIVPVPSISTFSINMDEVRFATSANIRCQFCRSVAYFKCENLRATRNHG